MEGNFDRALSLVLKHEGGFVQHKDDPGGATNRGITLATYRRFRKSPVSVEDLRAISNEEVWQIYRQFYWDVIRGDDLPSGIDYAVFDFGVNSGPGRAARFLQRIAGVSQDGVIGPITLAAVRALPPEQLITTLCNERLSFLKRLPTWHVFGKGWGRRVEDVRREALTMAETPAASDSEEPARPVAASPAAGEVDGQEPSVEAAASPDGVVPGTIAVASSPVSSSAASSGPGTESARESTPLSPPPSAPSPASGRHPAPLAVMAGIAAAVLVSVAGALTYFWNRILALFGG